MVTKAHKCAPS